MSETSELNDVVAEMYFKDGMKESEIAVSLGISVLEVNQILAALETSDE